MKERSGSRLGELHRILRYSGTEPPASKLLSCQAHFKLASRVDLDSGNGIYPAHTAGIGEQGIARRILRLVLRTRFAGAKSRLQIRLYRIRITWRSNHYPPSDIAEPEAPHQVLTHHQHKKAPLGGLFMLMVERVLGYSVSR